MSGRTSRWERLLLGLLGAYLVLWPFEPLSGAIYGIRVVLQIGLYLIGAGVLGRIAYRIARALTRRFLWRVRHRMMAVFVFVGVIPLGLSLMLTVFGVVLVFGPLAADMVSSEIEKRAEALYASADSLAWELRAAAPEQRREIGGRFLADAAARYPGLLVRFETPQGPITAPPGFRLDDPPPSLEDYRGLVRLRDELYLAAYAQYESGAPSLLLMVPLTERNLLDIVPGLGVVQPAEGFAAARGLGSGGPASGDAQAATSSGTGGATGDGGPRIPRLSDRPVRMRLPEPAHPFDRTVRWRAQTPVLDWSSGSIGNEAALVLVTRSSAVAGLIFRNQSPEMARIAQTLGYTLWGLFGLTLLVSTVVAVSLTRTVTSAINDLYVGAGHVSRGDFSHRIPVQGYTQLTELARSFNSMTGSIERLIVDSRERERLESELAIATEVQQQLFPLRAPKLEKLEVLGVCRAARMVSGDFYDYVKLPDGRLALTFGDVAGKGISAALVMASVQSVVRTQLARVIGVSDLAKATAEVVSETNRQICATTASNKFATLLFAVYDESRHELSYCNAGHLPPLLLHNGQVSSLEVTGMVIGAFRQTSYEARVVEMESGDLLAAFTDGVTEPENPYSQEFGEDRLAEILRQEADQPIERIIDSVMQEVEEWSGRPELQDDMTMLVARRLG